MAANPEGNNCWIAGKIAWTETFLSVGLALTQMRPTGPRQLNLGLRVFKLDSGVLSRTKSSFWIKGGAPGQVIISQAGGANWISADASGNLITELKADRGRPLISQTVITDGAWHRVGLVWDGSNRTLCVDDVEVAKDTQSTLEGSEGGLHIGAGKSLDPASFFSGLIDDVRIYDRAVTP